ncbi:hypothetical protein ACEWY4_014239 [Coilia grayii]|uniref:Uncharacterized protein n=1 Tax=Coilia grayii TaxID=363190 RepID=A0ABD1JRW1_9TELE
MQIKWIKRFLLRLMRDPPFLLALLLIILTICPFIILSFSKGLFSINVWFEVLSLGLSVLFGPFGFGVFAVVFIYGLVKAGFGPTLVNIQQRWTGWMYEFNLVIWDMEYALEQEKGKAIVVYYAKKSSKERSSSEQKEPYDEEKELTQHFYDGRMKYFGYQNYVRFLLKNAEDLKAQLKASVSEQNPAGDPMLLEEARLGRMLLRQEARRIDERLKDGTWG